LTAERVMREPQEHEFTCPYCWETISMVLEPTSDTQAYIEDCEVCCNPIEIRFRGEGGELVEFDAQPIEQ